MGRTEGDALTIGTVLAGRYELVSEIGRGGCAAVFEAYDHRLHRRVAIKLPIRMSDDTVKISRFTRESRVVASIQHPNVCAVLDTGVTERGTPFLVMERLYGESLRTRLTRTPKMNLREAVAIGLQLLSALNAVHNAGIVHRDIKPDNIMLVRRDGCEPLVKLLDFGLCRREGAGGEEETVTCEGSLIGTPEYMAPEQVIGSAVDVRADLYAVGVLLYEMLTGTRAFFAHKLADILTGVMHKKIVPLRQIRPDAPRLLEQALTRAMERHPTRRHTSARELQRDLQYVKRDLEERAAAQRSTPPPLPPAPSTSRRRISSMVPRQYNCLSELPTVRRITPIRRTGTSG